MGKEIYLSEEEQVYLKSIVQKGVHPAKVITRARVLLMLDRTGKSDHWRSDKTYRTTKAQVPGKDAA